MRIEDCQIGGPERLPNVGNIGHQGISQAQREGQRRGIDHGTTGTLCDHGDDATCGAHQEQWQLLQQQTHPPASK